MNRLFLLSPLLASSLLVQADPQTAADAYLKKAYPAEKPGAAVLVVHNGATALLNGYGLADVEKKTPITPDTAFDLASVSKQFTAMAIMLLAERGRLHYDDSATRWIPDLPEFDAPRPITLRDLLNHTSGLPDYLGVFKGNDDEFAKLSCGDIPKMLTGKKLRFAPGSKFEYSNTNYALLPLVVERATGKNFARFLHDYVFAPLNMNGTQVADAVPYSVANRATGYGRKLFSNKLFVSRRDGPICGDGNVFTTVRDMANWDAGLNGERLVRQSTLAEAWTPPQLPDGKKTSYGFGWLSNTKNGKRTVSHNGGWAGTHTVIVRQIDDKLTIVVLCNDEGANPEKTAADLARIFVPIAKEDAASHESK